MTKSRIIAVVALVFGFGATLVPPAMAQANNGFQGFGVPANPPPPQNQPNRGFGPPNGGRPAPQAQPQPPRPVPPQPQPGYRPPPPNYYGGGPGYYGGPRYYEPPPRAYYPPPRVYNRYDDEDCYWTRRRVMTPYGWRWRRVKVCE